MKNKKVPDDAVLSSPAKEVHTYIQINSICNQKCIFCNRPPVKDSSLLKPEVVKKRITEASKHPEITRIIFTGGEPIMHPDIFRMLVYAKKYGFVTEIQTNGTLMNFDKLLELKKTGLDIINFAFHSHKRETSNKLRRVNFGFDDIIKNIKLADMMGFRIHIIHVINSFNYRDIPAFIDYINRMKLRSLRLNLSIVVPEGWAWENKQVIPKMRDIKPYLMEGMRRCRDYKISFDISEIVPLCIVNGYEEHAISTLFRVGNIKIIDDYVTGKRTLDFADPGPGYAAKAPQCDECSLNSICAGFYPRLPELYGVADFVPRRDAPVDILKKINPGPEITDMFRDKKIEAFSHKEPRKVKTLYINLDEKCNQNCLFCVVKGENAGKFGSMSRKDADDTIKKFASLGGSEIIFTGGEPTTRNDLPDIIKSAEQLHHISSISIITNGIKLSDGKYTDSLIRADKRGIMGFCVSLHSHKEKISDWLTDAPGTFKKTIFGIKNIIKKGRRLSVYHVITKANYRDIPDFVKFLNERYPEIKHVTFAYPFPQGNALLNPGIYVSIALLRRYLIKALAFLEKNGYTVNIATCGQFPLCAVPGFEEKVLNPISYSEENIAGVVGEKAFHEFEMASDEWIKQYKNKGKKCGECIMNAYCQGFWKQYIELFGFEGINPVTRDNWTGNKIKSSLENETQMSGITDKINRDKFNLIEIGSFTRDYIEKLVDFIKKEKIFAVIMHKNIILYPKINPVRKDEAF